jgi:hypothetical protein
VVHSASACRGPAEGEWGDHMLMPLHVLMCISTGTRTSREVSKSMSHHAGAAHGPVSGLPASEQLLQFNIIRSSHAPALPLLACRSTQQLHTQVFTAQHLSLVPHVLQHGRPYCLVPPVRDRLLQQEHRHFTQDHIHSQPNRRCAV